MIRLFSGMTLCALALVAGCGNNTTMNPMMDMAMPTGGDMAMAPPADMTTPPDMTPPVIPVPAGCDTTTVVSGTTAYNTISLNNRCAQNCHNAATAPLFNSRQTFMNVMVGQQSTSAFKYVVANQPNNSYLLYKLMNLQMNVPNGSGSQMPQVGTKLSNAELCTMYDWILHGAPTN